MIGLSQNGIDVPKATLKGASLVPAETPAAGLITTSSPIADQHSIHSSLREKLIEHLFVGELLRCLWRSGCRDIEVLRSEVDAGGYDLAIECNGVLRHLQLKASHAAAKTNEVNINMRLAQKPSGCVIWMRFDSETLALGPFFWFGGDPGYPIADLGNKTGRHTKANQSGEKSDRPGIRVLKQNAFVRIDQIEQLAGKLFGITPRPVCDHP